MASQLNTTLEQALEIAKQRLGQFATDPEFLSKMQVAFGDTWETNQGITFGQAWQTADFSIIPPIEIRPAAEINGASGGYAGATNTIYISAEFLSQNATNLEPVTRVLLEEIGHAVDWQLNEYDTPGDEGAIFSALASGAVLSEAQLAQLRGEDDTAMVSLNGQNLQIQQAVPIHPDDYAALQALYNSTDGANWTNKTGWDFSNPSPDASVVNGWWGVYVDPATGRVKGIHLDGNNLSGSIPPELGNLSSLEWLILQSNNLSGSIPPELGNLSSLQSLSLGGNNLSGSIPPELGNLSSLQSLWLSGNDLSGTIPPELGNLSSLQWLSLDTNSLSGSIPPELGNLSSLKLLFLQNNDLSGTIPSEVLLLAGNLSDLGLSLNNNLSGSIPPELLSLSNLSSFTLSNSSLNSIPSELFSWNNLHRLDLSGNNLTFIPPEIGNLSSLTDLFLYNNSLTSIPPEIGNLSSLTDLLLYNNSLTSIPPEIGNLSSLERLHLHKNSLTSIPPELGNLNSLKYLFLQDNSLTEIPESVNNLLPSLIHYNLGDLLTGATLSINDIQLAEGNNGITNAIFTVTLSESATETVTVSYTTADDTATAGVDYTATTGTLTFNPGETEKTITVPIIGDTEVEPDETFKVTLSNPTGATLADSEAIGTITNDDVNGLSINDVQLPEGNSGNPNGFVFQVTLPQPSTETVTVDYATADGTATAGEDYQANSGTLTFNPGTTEKGISVWVNPDTTVEPDETFKVNLSNAVGASIADGEGIGTITNDDTASSTPQQPVIPAQPATPAQPVSPAQPVTPTITPVLPSLSLGNNGQQPKPKNPDPLDFSNPNHTITYGPLMLKMVGDDEFAIKSTGFSGLGANVQIGLKPTQGEEFKPLMTLLGGDIVGYNGNINAHGSIQSNINGQDKLLFYGELNIKPGQTATSEVLQDFSYGQPPLDIGGAEVSFDKLSFINPNQGSTDDAYLRVDCGIMLPEGFEGSANDFVQQAGLPVEESESVPGAFSQRNLSGQTGTTLEQSRPDSLSFSQRLNLSPVPSSAADTAALPQQPLLLEMSGKSTAKFTATNKNPQSYSPERPLLILPGIGGSFVKKDDKNAMRLWTLNRGLAPDRLQIDPIGGVYNHLISTLKNFGYKEGETLFAAPYDWRLPPFPDDDGKADGKISKISSGTILDNTYEYGVDYLGYWLKQASETWAKSHNGKLPESVDIIAHSTGGLVTRAYIQSDAYGGNFNSYDGKIGNLPKINNFIMAAVPNLGAPKAWNPMHDDWNGDFISEHFMVKFPNASYQKLWTIGPSTDVPTMTTTGGSAITLNVRSVSSESKILGGGEIISADTLKGQPFSREQTQDFIEQYAPTLRALSPTYPFIYRGNALVSSADVDPTKVNTFLKDLNSNGDNSLWVQEIATKTKPTVIYGKGKPTILTVTQKFGTNPDIYSFLDSFLDYHLYSESITYNPHENQVWYEDRDKENDGDETVPKQSSFGPFQGKNNVTTQAFSANHGGIVSDIEAQKFIVKTLIGRELQKAEFQQISVPAKYYEIDKKIKEFGSNIGALFLNLDPVEGFVVDANGNRLGYSEATGPVTEIPNSIWFGDTDGFGFVSGEIATPVQLQLTGLGEDHYVDLTIQQGNQFGSIESRGFLAKGETKNLPVELTEVLPENPNNVNDTNLIIGTEDEDTLSGSEGDNIILGMSADDYLLASGSDCFLNGNKGDDILQGNYGNDILHGGQNEDAALGMEGDDQLYGDLGNDDINGNQGDDWVEGGDGDDILHGGQNEDNLLGNAGADILYGDLGDDNLNGNQGDDWVEGGDGYDTLHGGQNNDTLSGNTGADILYGDLGTDLLEGNEDADTLYGGADSDSLSGGDSDDVLEGGTGNDLLNGDEGNDILTGVDPTSSNPGSGELDTLTGSEGNDTFVLGNGVQSFYTGNGDNDYAVITDFELDGDILQLQGTATNYRLAEVSTVVGHYTGIEGEQDILQTNTQIFRSANGADDLIAVVQGAEGLTLESAAFSFV